MQLIFGQLATELAKTGQFIKRTRKLTGEKSAQILIFSWLSNANATYYDMAQTTLSLGIKISPQAIEKRFTEESAQLLLALLDKAFLQVVETGSTATALFCRFSSVIVADSTTITLPDELSSLWSGCGGSCEKNTQSSMKVQASVDLKDGGLQVSIHDGKASDNMASIRVSNLGYFNLTVFSYLSAEQSFWLSRLKLSTRLVSQDGKVINLGKWLATTQRDVTDSPVLLGKRRKLPARFLAHRVADDIANARRRKIRANAKKKGHQPSKRRLAVSDWIILVTNVPSNLLTADEALTVMRIRWQIELIFKLWKSVNSLDKSRSEKKWRILTEVYGKLLVVLLQHWLIVMGAW